MKDEREQSTKMLTHQVAKSKRESEPIVEGYHAQRRALNALTYTEQYELKDKIENCAHTRRCQSPWCSHCRPNCKDAIRKQMEQKPVQAIKKIYQKLTGLKIDVNDPACSDFMNDNLFHVSGYIGLFSWDADLVKKGIEFDRRRWKKIKERKLSSSFSVAGNYELELVNFKALLNTNNDDSQKKKIQIRQLVDFSKKMGWIKGNEDAAILLHWHGITDGTKQDLAKAFGTDFYFDGKKLFKVNDSGVYIQKFHLNQAFETNLNKISSYGIKNPTRYKHSFIGSDVGDELMLKQELSDLVSIYDQVQGRSWRSLILSHTIG